MKHFSKIFFLLMFALSLAQPSLGLAITAEDKAEVLTFVKDYLLLESKNSGIFELNSETGESRWFELYGILSEIRTTKDVHTVIVDADVFGYSDMHYLLYFDVSRIEGRWVMMKKRIGPRHQRQLTDNLSMPN